MNRREAIKRTSLLMGYAVSASAIAGIMNGCKADPIPAGTSWQPAFFDQNQFKIVEEVAERILPATDTPGAKDVNVPPFIDQMLKENYDAAAQKRVTDGLAAIEAASQKEYSQSFLTLSDEEKDALLTEFDQAAYEAAKLIEEDTQYKLVQSKANQVTVGEAYLGTNKDHFFHILKELTFLGYYTSEKIATTVLRYDPIPGNYDACIDYPENGKAWAY